jgi:hypothetical protein
MEILGRVHLIWPDATAGHRRCLGYHHRHSGYLAEDTDDRTWEMEGIAMNESDCKLITEWLGLCWHDYDWVGKDGVGWRCKCGHETYLPDTFHHNRTFTDPQDFFACFEKLVELGKWIGFEDFAGVEYTNDDSPFIPYTTWLLSRTESGHYRLCVLCAEWLKAQGTVVEWRQATDKTTWS